MLTAHHPDQQVCGGGGYSLRPVLGHHGEGDHTAGVLDDLDDVVVGQLYDGASVHRRDAVAHVQQATAVCGAALDDAANLMGDH